MSQKYIELDFGAFTCRAELFDTKIAEKFAEHLPYKVSLVQWGKELYGPIGRDLGEEDPTPRIPPGGIAYTREGNYVCVFFGQTPAWSVEYIGKILNNEWEKLVENASHESVEIRMCDD